MALVVPNATKEAWLKAALNHTAQNQNYVLKLFTNNVTPGESDTAATFTAQAEGGISNPTLTGSSFTFGTAANVVTASFAEQTFTFTSVPGTTPNNYGYFTTRTTGGELGWAERFTGAPYTIANVNDAIKVTAKVTMALAA
jgi:hypothetical protein